MSHLGFRTILVAPGTYLEFGMSGGTVRALTPGTVHVQRNFFGSFFGAVGVPTHVVGIHFDVAWAVHGTVVFDRCSMTGLSPLQALQSMVHLQQCSLQVTPLVAGWPNHALSANSAHVTAIDTTFDASPSGGSAVSLSGSTFHGSRVVLQAASSPALALSSGSQAWLVDATLTTVSVPCPILGTGGHMERTTLVPNCGGLPAGPVLGVSRPGPLQVGQPFVLDFQAQPLETVAVFASSGLARMVVPGIEQAVLLDPANTWLAFVLTADAQGLAPMTWNVPPLPSLVDTTAWFQGIGLANAPMQASPVAGGQIR